MMLNGLNTTQEMTAPLYTVLATRPAEESISQNDRQRPFQVIDNLIVRQIVRILYSTLSVI